MADQTISFWSRLTLWAEMAINMVDKYIKLDDKITGSLLAHQRLLDLLVEMADEFKMKDFPKKVMIYLSSRNVESEVDNVAFLHNIFLARYAEEPLFACRSLRSCRDVVIVRYDLRLDETLFEIGMYPAGSLGRLRTLHNGPRVRFFRT